MPKNKQRRRRNRRNNAKQSDAFLAPTIPRSIPANTATLRMVWNFMADTTSVLQFTAYFRPTTFAFGTNVFGFYPDGYFNNVIREMRVYFDIVEYASHTVRFTPPHQLAGSEYTTSAAPQCILTRDQLLTANINFSGYANVTNVNPVQGNVVTYSPSAAAKELGVPHKKLSEEALFASATTNYQYPLTVGYCFPDHVGAQPTSARSFGTFRVETVFIFSSKSA